MTFDPFKYIQKEKEKINFRKQKGICENCGEIIPTKDSLVCKKCAEEFKKQSQLNYERSKKWTNPNAN